MSGPDPLVGELAIFPSTFAPRNWVVCNGQQLLISAYPDLFGVIGTTYGGNGVTHFQVPNLNGRAVLGVGDDSDGNVYREGDRGGASTVPLKLSEMPAHTHATLASSEPATVGDPVGSVPAAGDVALHNAQVTDYEQLGTSGAGRAHNNMQPSLELLYCIAVRGTVPSRG